MLLTEYEFTYDVVLGIAILVGLSLMLTFISSKDFDLISFIAWMTIINPFLIYFGLSELWLEVLFVVILAVLMGIKLNGGGNNGGNCN